MNKGNFLQNCNNVFLFLRTTSEEPGILSYCPRTTANKLPHNFGNISERRGIMESYRLLQRYFHKVHNVIVDTIFQTWVAHICLRGCRKGETVIRCRLMTVIASGASFASYNKRLEWKTPQTADRQEKRQPALIVRNKERTLFHTCWANEHDQRARLIVSCMSPQ